MSKRKLTGNGSGMVGNSKRLGGDFVKKKAAKDTSCNDLSPEAGGGERKTQLRLKTLLDVRRFLARVLNDLDANRIQESKAKALGYLCSIMKDIIRDSDLEQRIEKLEQGVKNDNAR
jgi:hypothetical protein